MNSASAPAWHCWCWRRRVGCRRATSHVPSSTWDRRSMISPLPSRRASSASMRARSRSGTRSCARRCTTAHRRPHGGWRMQPSRRCSRTGARSGRGIWPPLHAGRTRMPQPPSSKRPRSRATAAATARRRSRSSVPRNSRPTRRRRRVACSPLRRMPSAPATRAVSPGSARRSQPRASSLRFASGPHCCTDVRSNRAIRTPQRRS